MRTPIDRREFLRLAGTASLVGVVASIDGCTTRPHTPGHPPTTSPTPSAPATTSAASSATAASSTSAPPPIASSTPASALPTDLDALSKVLGDRLIRPSDAGYLNASQLYSPRFDGVKPAAIARCTSSGDVQACLALVRATGIKVTARSGGHSYAGYSTTSGLVIDVGPMNGISMLDTTTARIGSGATLIDVYAGLAAANVGVAGGSCPTVGITGSTLGGGIGVLARKYGLSCDAVSAVELVTPDGTIVRATENADADLFWAHRGGGGGNFGVVTALEFTTHPTSTLTRFLTRWSWASAHDVVTAWQQWLPTTPNALWASLHLDGAGSASDQAHVYVTGVFVGPASGLNPLLDALQSASNATMTTRYVQEGSYLETMYVEGGCADLTALACHRSDTTAGGTLGREANAARSDFLAQPLPSAGVDALLTGVEQRRTLGLPGGSVLFDAYGGAINAIGATDTAFVNRDMLACLQYVAPWGGTASASVIAANQSWLDALYASMRPYVSGYAYVNYIDAQLPDWQHAYYGVNLARLITVKAAVDPSDLLSFAQGIPTH